ncbi:hypothetical protein HDV02_005689 [Globomyces sp. JEL0801]|nr:hypothetical protein HDV02_005689 [Globomyces sp. JEL0801]
MFNAYAFILLFAVQGSLLKRELFGNADNQELLVYSNNTCSDPIPTKYPFNTCVPSRNAQNGVIKFFCNGPVLVRQQFRSMDNCSANAVPVVSANATGRGCRQFLTGDGQRYSWISDFCSGAPETNITTTSISPITTSTSLTTTATSSPTNTGSNDSTGGVSTIAIIGLAFLVVILILGVIAVFLFMRNRQNGTKVPETVASPNGEVREPVSDRLN